ncbi:MAG: HAMP domain-containing histidine kinase [Bacteroidia bacterium]|nr:HAMP domain-containing histidine kinase [Bacteroidia bacterium]
MLKAYDEFGYSKLQYLRNVLIIIFIVIAGIMILGSLFLANIISKPITALADQMKKININKTHFELSNTRTTSTEIDYLQEQFKELLTRTHESFVFQKNAVQHISHELKTPIAVLVSELERIKNISSDVKLHEQLGEQVCRAKSLGDIINTLLEISKVEAGQATIQKDVRMDECLFDIMDELKVLYTDFSFELQYKPDSFKESDLIIKANEQLLKQALLNILLNAIRYSNNKKAQITIDCTNYHSLKIDITNSGKTLAPEEVKFLFQHFFRGANSKQHSGFGLGLVLSQKIIILHNGNISYAAPTPGLNVFSIEFEKQNHTL